MRTLTAATLQRGGLFVPAVAGLAPEPTTESRDVFLRHTRAPVHALIAASG
jgi:hypothetical protein